MSDKRVRLGVEEQLLRKYFPSVRIQDKDGGPNLGLVGRIHSNSGTVYTLFCPLQEFPERSPPVYVIDPKLRCYDGKLVSDLGSSNAMHVLAPSDHGHPQICHYNDRYWESKLTLYKVLLKCRIWLEAYECHLREGKPVDHYLSHM